MICRVQKVVLTYSWLFLYRYVLYLLEIRDVKCKIVVYHLVFFSCCTEFVDRIPQQTSVHLRNLLLGLLKRNPVERMSFGSSHVWLYKCYHLLCDADTCWLSGI